jgi:flagellar motor switch protein FliN/FliY
MVIMSDEPPSASPQSPQDVPVNPEPTIDPVDAALVADAAPIADAAPSADAAPVAGAETVADAASPLEGGIDQATIDELLKQASFEDPTAAGADAVPGDPDVLTPAGEPFELPNFNQVMADAQISSIDLLRDVELNVKIELGRSRMLVEDVLKLGEGSVVELDKLAGDPVDVFVNDRLVARGEVLVLNENFCVRVNEIVAGVKDEGQ